jgi:hypothetical protein
MNGAATIPPQNRFEIACAIAGALAESGVCELRIVRQDRPEIVAARSTDLPARLSEGDVELTGKGLRLTVRGDRLEWEAQDAALGSALEAACA